VSDDADRDGPSASGALSRSPNNRPCRSPGSGSRTRIGSPVTWSASFAATLRAYRSDWAILEQWCAARALVTLPATPVTVAAFLIDLAKQGRARSTIGRRFAAIVFAHRAAGHLRTPDVRWLEQEAVHPEKVPHGIHEAPASAG